MSGRPEASPIRHALPRDRAGVVATVAANEKAPPERGFSLIAGA
jgi:hypothetical protein